ncbi:hypothetical protein BDN70DRAFT_194974 [Pholiota conissans]|uniref:Uncharacterized protein n=1 Tax=Pholiota conissans TaxID=109636 RepID=A0A9P5ZDP0_9AGAR|nr:hypothetical protein BDN70DRAFT_194974 [Pholiota conissans]
MHFAKNTFKVEKGTSIDMFVHRLLQCTIHFKELGSLSLLQRPELYERVSDGRYPKVPSLLPSHTVDKYVEYGLVLTVETRSNAMIPIANTESRPIPPGWTNIWVIGKKDNDQNFTLRRFTNEQFHMLVGSGSSVPHYGQPGSATPNMQMPQPHPAVLPYNTSGLQRNTQDFQPSPSLDPASTAQGRNPRMPAPVPLQNVPRAGGVANPSLPPPPETTPVQPTPSSRSSRPSYTATSSTFTVDSTTSSQNAKMQIPDSAAASHHTTGDMKTVGREKKPDKSSGGFMSKIKSWWV